jgi:hypothetical protein
MEGKKKKKKSFVEKLIVTQQVKHFQPFMEPEFSLPYSQQLATCPSPEPEESSPNRHILCPYDPF